MHNPIKLIFLLCLIGVHTLNAIGTGNRTVFNNSVVPLPKAALAQPLQPQHLSELMEIEIPLQMRGYAELIDKTAKQKSVSQADLEKNHLPLQADYEAVKNWLISEGFTITHTDPNRLAVFAKGTVAQIQTSLQVEMLNVTVNGKDFRAARSHPSLPQNIATPVLGINGLQPYLQMHKRSTTTAYAVPYSINDILTAYSATNLGVTGSGQKIAILIDTVPLDSDLTSFWIDNNIPQTLSNIEKINVNNLTLPAPTGEESLDVEWSSSIAPAAKVRVYAAGSLSFIYLDLALQRIISDLPTQTELHQLSISLGLGETNLIGSSQMQTDSQYLALIAAAGVTVFASSGDYGATPDNNGVLQVEYYSSDPSVTGVGGTSLTMSSTGTVTSETTWAGSGGGVSQVFTRPSWQTGTGVTTGTMRLVPDVALVGDPNTGTNIYVNGITEQVGGTSWGTPAWAAFCALINEARAKIGQAPIGLLGPNIYPLIGSNNFRDITTGNNGNYYAGVGYDQTTGIGVPIVSNLLQTLTGTSSTPPSISSFTPTSGPVASNVTITGVNFNNVTAVKFNGASASFTVKSSTQIIATAPNVSSIGPISVITTSGSATSLGSFNILSTLFSTGFESSEGYIADILSGQNGWLNSGGSSNSVLVDIVDGAFLGYGNQATLGGTPPTSGTSQSVWKPINYTPIQGETVTFSVLFDIIDSTPIFDPTAPRDRFRFSVYNIAGTRLFSIEFNNANNDANYILDDNVTHLIAPQTLINNTLFAVQISVNSIQNSWSATLNGSPLVTGLPATTGTESLDFGGFRVECVQNSPVAGNNYIFCDNYNITKSNWIPSGSATISTWKSAYFTTLQLANSSISGDQANPSGDGICNLLDYAFNLNPNLHNNQSVLPQTSVSGGYLSLTYTSNSTASDLTYTVEVSSDLQTWKSGIGYTSPPLILSDNGITQQIQVSDLTPSTIENKRFIRLRVTAP